MKNIKYAVIWVIFFAAFNAAAFFNPNAGSGSFWLGYGFSTAAFVFNIVYALIVLKKITPKTNFYNVLILFVSNFGLVAVIAAGEICMFSDSIPYYSAAVMCILILALYISAAVGIQYVINILPARDDEIKSKTYVMRQLTADAQVLMISANTENLKMYAKKVYESLRYSDPMSRTELNETEEQIQRDFAAFENSVTSGDEELAEKICTELTTEISKRNTKCRLLK